MYRTVAAVKRYPVLHLVVLALSFRTQGYRSLLVPFCIQGNNNASLLYISNKTMSLLVFALAWSHVNLVLNHAFANEILRRQSVISVSARWAQGITRHLSFWTAWTASWTASVPSQTDVHLCSFSPFLYWHPVLHWQWDLAVAWHSRRMSHTLALLHIKIPCSTTTVSPNRKVNILDTDENKLF